MHWNQEQIDRSLDQTYLLVLEGPLERQESQLWLILGTQTLVANIKKVKSLSCVRLFATLWTVARQAPLSMGFSRQEY